MKTLKDLKKGETGVIRELIDSEISTKLLDMGCLPGEIVELKYFAPLGDPICVRINGYDLMLRKLEASKVIVDLGS